MDKACLHTSMGVGVWSLQADIAACLPACLVSKPLGSKDRDPLGNCLARLISSGSVRDPTLIINKAKIPDFNVLLTHTQVHALHMYAHAHVRSYVRTHTPYLVAFGIVYFPGASHSTSLESLVDINSNTWRGSGGRNCAAVASFFLPEPRSASSTSGDFSLPLGWMLPGCCLPV